MWSAKTRRFPSSRRDLCHAPPIDCKLSTNRRRKPMWRRCVGASIAVGPSAILTGSRTRPSDWGWNRGFGPVEDQRNNRRLATVTGRCLLFFLLYSPNLVAVSFPFPHSIAQLADGLKTNATVQRNYIKFYSVSAAPEPSPQTIDIFRCGILSVTPAEFEACYHGEAEPHRSPPVPDKRAVKSVAPR